MTIFHTITCSENSVGIDLAHSSSIFPNQSLKWGYYASPKTSTLGYTLRLSTDLTEAVAMRHHETHLCNK